MRTASSVLCQSLYPSPLKEARGSGLWPWSLPTVGILLQGLCACCSTWLLPSVHGKVNVSKSCLLLPSLLSRCSVTLKGDQKAWCGIGQWHLLSQGWSRQSRGEELRRLRPHPTFCRSCCTVGNFSGVYSETSVHLPLCKAATAEFGRKPESLPHCKHPISAASPCLL